MFQENQLQDVPVLSREITRSIHRQIKIPAGEVDPGAKLEEHRERQDEQTLESSARPWAWKGGSSSTGDKGE